MSGQVAIRTLLALYVLLLALVLLQPTPTVATAAVSRATALLVELRAPEVLIVSGRVEFMLNALMFAPVAFLAHLGFTGLRWATWVVGAFVASAAIELTQGYLLPARSAEYVDVVANTFGALVGVTSAVALASLTHRPQSGCAPGAAGARRPTGR